MSLFYKSFQHIICFLEAALHSKSLGEINETAYSLHLLMQYCSQRCKKCGDGSLVFTKSDRVEGKIFMNATFLAPALHNIKQVFFGCLFFNLLFENVKHTAVFAS